MNGTHTTDRTRPTDRAMSIGDVERAIGVAASTIRSWERRFGYPAPGRSFGGHRRYSSNDVRALAIVRDEVARGRSVGEAVAMASVALSRADDATGRSVGSIVRAAIAADAAAIERELAKARADIGAGSTVVDVALPALREIGWAWELGSCDVPREHLASETIRRWLRAERISHATERGTPVIACAGPLDEHTGGLEAFATLLALRRVPALVTSRATDEAVAGLPAGAIVVVASHLASHRSATVAALRGLARTHTVFFGGGAFLRPRARAGVPGRYLGEDLREAADVVADAWRTASRRM